MIADSRQSLLQQWRQQILADHPKASARRSLGALGYLANGPVLDGMIEIEKLVLVALFDELSSAGRACLRLVGVSAEPVPWGISWGEAAGSRFFKNLLLEPSVRAHGRRIDLRDEAMLHLGLLLEKQLRRHFQQRWLPVRLRPQLPRLWAGFRRSQLSQVRGEGPEFAAACRRRGLAPDRLLASAGRAYQGLTALPLEWVSHCWSRATVLCADLERYPRFQVFAVNHFPVDLTGYQGAMAYDFFTSRFRGLGVPKGSS